MSKVEFLLSKVDLINDWVGRIVAFVFVPLTFFIAFEVISRYFFNRPTIWVWDVSVQLGGLIMVLGGGYGLLHGAHIIVDVFIEKLTLRKKAILNVFNNLVFFFPIGILVWKTWDEAWGSLLIGEKVPSILAPPLYPFKVMLFIGALLLLFQGVAKFIRDFIALRSLFKKKGY